MGRFLFSILLALTLAACSGVKFAYNQLDWFLPRYIERYADLNDMQSALVKDQIAELLRWHCGTQVVGYASSLRQISADASHGPATYERMVSYTGQFVHYWRALVDQVAPKAAALLATATDEQVNELFVRLKEENEKFRDEYVNRPEPERRQAAAEKMKERLEDWVDDLTPAQQRAVGDWSERLALYGPEQLQFRMAWQGELRRALDRRGNTDEFIRSVTALFEDPERLWSDDYRRKRDQNREETLKLFVTIFSSLSPNQYRHFADRANSWAADFEQLACAAPTIRTTAADRAPSVVAR